MLLYRTGQHRSMEQTDNPDTDLMEAIEQREGKTTLQQMGRNLPPLYIHI
jgi:hypothetical protein